MAAITHEQNLVSTSFLIMLLRLIVLVSKMVKFTLILLYVVLKLKVALWVMRLELPMLKEES